jgi:hypothetical protein
MHSPIAATALLKSIAHKRITPKAAARFAVRAFRAVLRFPTRTVRKPQAVVVLGTIEPSHVRIDTSEGEEIPGTTCSRSRKTWSKAQQQADRASAVLRADQHGRQDVRAASEGRG